jgi:hypothetical protein
LPVSQSGELSCLDRRRRTVPPVRALGGGGEESNERNDTIAWPTLIAPGKNCGKQVSSGTSQAAALLARGDCTMDETTKSTGL